MRAHRLTLLSLLAAIVVSAFLVAACGGDDDEESADTQTTEQRTTPAGDRAGAAPRRLTVRMDEFQFEPEDVTIRRGGTLTVENRGRVSHNLKIREGESVLAGTDTFLPPRSERLEVDVPPGDYEIVCTVPGHEESGMVGSITVE